MHWLIRTVWFLVVGWWLGFFWMAASLLVMCTIVLAPIGAAMLSQTGKVMMLTEDPETVRVESDD